MPDIKELGRKVKAKYPGVYDDLPDDVLGRKVKAKYPGAYDDFADAAGVRPPERGVMSAISGGLASAAGEYLVEPAVSLYEAGKSAVKGDFGPARNLAESTVRGGLGVQAALLGGPSFYKPVAQTQAPAIAQLQAEREAALAQTPAGQYVQRRRAQLAEEAKGDTSLTNRLARGAAKFVGAAAPAVATGVLTGGSAPAIAATTALQSAAQPENATIAAAASVLPVPVGQAFKAGVNAVRRAFGKGAAQIVEAEALPAATAQVRQSIGEATPTIQRAMQQFEQEVQRIKTLPPGQQAAEMEAAIQNIGREASGVRPVSEATRRGYPPQMVMPENPNAIQQAGVMPRVFGEAETPPPGLEAQAGPMRVTVRPPIGPGGVGDLPPSHGLPALEAELGVSAAPSVSARGPSASVTGPPVGASMNLDAAIADAAESVPRSLAQKTKDELLGVLGAFKSLRSTGDASYPMRQGALLLLRPLQWRQAARVWQANFRAFRTKNFEAIKQAIDTHPLAGRMETAGLRPFPHAGEEAFAKRAGSRISEAVQKAPILKQSEQAYNASAATQRVGAFEQYARLIDKAKLSPEEALKADKAAAEWINITTGRGSLGKRIDKAMEGLNFFFFSPRYVASRLNVFNPMMYARNAASPGGRVVLKQQMSDLMQFASVVATTLYLAKQAGADVTLNPKSADFGKIKVGTWRWDMGAGLQQVMRLIYRVGADIGRAGKGEKPKFGESAIDIGETFLSYKLSPPAGVFRDFIKQRTVEGKPFTAGGAVRDLVAPMQWADFVEAYQKEGFGGVAKTLPGAVGIGVQNYDSPPVQAAIEKSQPLFTELGRLNKRVSELRKKEGEKDDAFNARVQQFGQNYTLYGLKLLENPRFKAAPDNIKALALDSLNNRAKAITHRELALPELVLDANTIMDAAESSKKNPANK